MCFSGALFHSSTTRSLLCFPARFASAMERQFWKGTSPSPFTREPLWRSGSVRPLDVRFVRSFDSERKPNNYYSADASMGGASAAQATAARRQGVFGYDFFYERRIGSSLARDAKLIEKQVHRRCEHTATPAFPVVLIAAICTFDL